MRAILYRLICTFSLSARFRNGGNDPFFRRRFFRRSRIIFLYLFDRLGFFFRPFAQSSRLYGFFFSLICFNVCVFYDRRRIRDRVFRNRLCLRRSFFLRSLDLCGSAFRRQFFFSGLYFLFYLDGFNALFSELPGRASRRSCRTRSRARRRSRRGNSSRGFCSVRIDRSFFKISRVFRFFDDYLFFYVFLFTFFCVPHTLDNITFLKY